MQAQAAGDYLEDHTSFLRRDPLGVAVGIAPWNYPLNMATWKLGPALAAGNTFILKPSELTPLTALKLAEIAADIFPPGVFNVVTGQGETAGDALVRSPKVAIVSVTGDVATGKLIAKNAADTLKRVHLELGGKAPVVVFDDADLDAVVECLSEMSYYNSGQDCTAPCRVIAGPGIYDVARRAGSARRSARWPPATRPIPTPRSARSSRPSSRSGSPAWWPGPSRPAPRSSPAASILDRPGFFYEPDRAGQPGPGQRDRAARGVRPGRQRAALRRRGAGHRAGPTASTTACRPASGPPTSAGPCA